MNLDGFALPIKKLKGIDPVESLDFSGKKLGPASVIVIASLIGDNASLTACNLRFNSLDEPAKQLLRDSVKDRPSFKLEL